MAKKDFSNKKPEIQVQATAVEKFIDNFPAPDPDPEPVKMEAVESEKANAALTGPADQEEPSHSNTLIPAPYSRKAKVNRENKRDKRLQLLITEDEYNYLTAVAWLNRRSVNDYMNMLIQKDMEKNPDAKYTFKGDK